MLQEFTSCSLKLEWFWIRLGIGGFFWGRGNWTPDGVEMDPSKLAPVLRIHVSSSSPPSTLRQLWDAPLIPCSCVICLPYQWIDWKIWAPSHGSFLGFITTNRRKNYRLSIFNQFRDLKALLHCSSCPSVMNMTPIFLNCFFSFAIPRIGVSHLRAGEGFMMVAREPPLGWFRFATDQRHQGYGSNSRIADGINLGIGDPPTCFRSFVPENPPWNPEISQASWIVSMSTFMDLVIFFAAQRGFFPTKLGIGPTSNEHFTAEKTLLSICFCLDSPARHVA